MAQVSYNDGVPEVAPRDSVPDDFQHEQATPAEFGGLIAQGAEKAGAGLSTAAKFFGQVQTDDAANTALTQANKQLNTFRSLTGADALRAQQPTQDAIDAAFKQGREGLVTPEQQYQYDSIVRSYQQRYISGIMASHADEQSKIYATKTNADAFTTAVNSITGVADKPDMVAGFQHDARDAAVRQLQVDGLENDPQAQKAAIAKADQAVAKAQIQAIAVNDPARAQRMVENYKDILGTDYEPMAGEVRTRAKQQNGVAAATDAANKAFQSQRDGLKIIDLPRLQNAILHQESGNRDNVGVSPTGAIGPGQIEPGTWAQYAQPGESITNPADNRAVSARILADYWQRYSGDPQRVAVAYFSGPGNVAPAGSPTPWRVNRNDGHTTVAQYVSGVTGQPAGIMSPGQPQGGDPYTLHAVAMQNLMQDPNIDDEAKQYGFQYLQRSFAQAQIAAEADVKAKKDANDSAMGDYVRQMLAPGGATPDLIDKMKNDQRLEGATLENLYTFAATKGGLDDPMQYGKAYADTYARILLPPDDPNRISDANDILKLGLPGGGLSGTGVQKALQIFSESRKDPDQAAVNQVKSSFLQYAKSKLSFDQEMLFPGVKPLADPKGAQIFDAQFVPKFEAWVSQQIKAGKDPMEFLTQDNVDKLMNGMRSKAQMAADRVSAEGQVTGEGMAAAPPPPAPEGVADATWRSLLQSPPQMATGQLATPRQYGDAINILAENPTADVKAKFNKWFGAKDAMADDILNKLAGQKPVMEAPPLAPASVAAPVPPKASLGEEANERLGEAGELSHEAAQRAAALRQGAEQRQVGLLQ